MTKWLSSNLLGSSASLATDPHLSPPSPGQCLISPSVPLLPRPNGTSVVIHCTWAQWLPPPDPCSCFRERTQLRPLLNYDYISLGSGRGKFAFKLTNLPNLWVCPRFSLYPISFLDLLGIHTVFLFNSFSRFSQARLLPFMVTILIL